MFVKWEEKNYKLVECVKFVKLGPGRPSAGGPRMDRRTVTSPGVLTNLMPRFAPAALSWQGSSIISRAPKGQIKKHYVTHAGR